MEQEYSQQDFEMISNISRNRAKFAENELRRALSQEEKRAIIASTVKKYLNGIGDAEKLIEHVLKYVR